MAERNSGMAGSVVDDGRNYCFQKFMTLEEAEKARLCGHLRQLQNKCRDVRVRNLKDMVKVVVGAMVNLDLEYQLMKTGRTLCRKLQRLKIVQKVASGAQHSALSKSSDAQQCSAQL